MPSVLCKPWVWTTQTSIFSSASYKYTNHHKEDKHKEAKAGEDKLN